MAKVLAMPQRQQPVRPATNPAFEQAKKNMEKRLGVSFLEYMGVNGDRAQVQAIIDRNLRKETFSVASRSVQM